MSASPDRRGAGGYAYLVLFASFFMMFAGTGSVYLLVATLKPIALEFGWPRTVPSIAYALQYLGGGLGGILMGSWMDRAGMAWPALLGATMIGAGSCLTGELSAAWQLFVIYGVMMGLAGRASLFAPLMANISIWFERRRGMAVGIVGSGQAVAGALWPALFQTGIQAVGWRETAFAYGVFVLATMVPMSLVFRRSAPVAAPVTGRASIARREAVMSPRRLTAWLCVAIIGCCTAMSMPLAHLMSHASDVGYSPLDGARLLSVMLICAALSSMFGLGALNARFGSIRTLIFFSTTQAISLGVIPLAGSLEALYLVAIAFGLGYGGVLPSYPMIIREHLGASGAGARTGLVIFFGTIGMALGSGLGGVSYDLTGQYAPAFYLGTLVNLGNVAVLAFLLRGIARARGA
jgi:MFS family permease